MFQFQSLHVCKICGKEFGTSKGIQGHQRMHSGKSKRMESPIDDNEFQRIWGFKKSKVCSVSTFSAKEISIVTETLDLLRTGGSSSLSLKDSSFMTGTEQQEIKEAAMNLVFLSERVYDFANIRNSPLVDISVDLELKVMQEKVIHSVETKQDFSEPLSHSDFDKFSTCSKIRFGDAVAQALPSPRRCKICGKCFRSYQALGGHQRVHRLITGKLTPKGTLEDGSSLSDTQRNSVLLSERDYDFAIIRNSSLVDISMDLELKAMQEKAIHCAERKQDCSGLVSQSAFDKSSTCSEIRFGDAVAQALPSSPHKCKTCGECFGCYRALGGHQKLHRPVIMKIEHKRRILEDGNSLSSSEAKTDTQMNLVSLSERDYDAATLRNSPPGDISVDLELKNMQEKIIHCAEMKQDFSQLLFHSGLDKSSTCSEIRFGDAVAQALPSSLHKCKTCGKCFGSYQALGGHQRVHSSVTRKLVKKWRILEDSSNSVSGSEVKNVVVSGPSSFEVSQKDLIQL